MRRPTAPGRTSETDIAIAALRVANAQPSGQISTARLKKMIPQFITLTPDDLAPSKTRPNEQMWHQIVGNIISHRDQEDNLIGAGYAEYTGTGIKITDSGRALLKKKRYI